jgi:hypothetical protein
VARRTPCSAKLNLRRRRSSLRRMGRWRTKIEGHGRLLEPLAENLAELKSLNCSHLVHPCRRDALSFLKTSILQNVLANVLETEGEHGSY